VAAQMNLPWVQLLTQPRDVWGAPLARVALLSEVLMGPLAPPGVVPPVELAGLSWFDGAGRRLPSAVEAFLMEGPPPVVFAFRGPDAAVVAKLYGHAAKVCAQLDLRAVLVGGDRVPGVSHLPGQLVLPWVSTAPLLPRSAALVSAGCMSLCGQAAMAGCPQVLVPMGWDQHDVAARFAREGGALKLTHRQATGEGLATALLRVVYGSALRRQASRWPDRINRVCGTVRAAHVIDGLFSLPRMSVQA
jgi:UDP:flavonoid glycosyltransferase YjiC (YdhE family)